MESQIKSRNKSVDIEDLYSVKAGPLWRAFKMQHVSFWMLCMYYFFEYVRPQTLYPVLDVLPWSQIFLLGSLFAVFFDKSVKWVASPLNKFLIFFYLVLIVSAVFAFIPMVSWGERNVVLTWFLVYFLTINIVNTETRLVIFLLAYFLFNLKMSQHGALAWALRGFSFAGWGLVGSPGWFRNSGEFAIQMLIFGSLVTAFVYSLKGYWGRYKRGFFFIVAATGYMAVMGASSRGAQLALVIIGVWLLLKQKWGFKGLAAVIIVAAILYSILPAEQMQRFNEMGEDQSSLQRLAYWQFGIEIIKDHPFLGIGYNNWLYYLQYTVPEGLGPQRLIQVSHNIFIQVAAELGCVALFIFVVMVLYAFVINVRTREMVKDDSNRLLFYLSYGLDAGIIGYLIAGFFVTVFFYPFFWIQLAMVVMVNNVASQQSVDGDEFKAKRNRMVNGIKPNYR